MEGAISVVIFRDAIAKASNLLTYVHLQLRNVAFDFDGK